MLQALALALVLLDVPAPATASAQPLDLGTISLTQAELLDGQVVHVRCTLNSLPWGWRGWIGYDVDGEDEETISRTVWIPRPYGPRQEIS